MLIRQNFLKQTRCVEIFDQFKTYHTSSGEIKVNWCFFKIREKVKGGHYLHFEKCYPLKSFQDIAMLAHETYKGKVLTHAVCWDLERKRILDSEYRNNEVFPYTSFDNDCQVANSIAEALCINNNKCSLYIFHRVLER